MFTLPLPPPLDLFSNCLWSSEVVSVYKWSQPAIVNWNLRHYDDLAHLENPNWEIAFLCIFEFFVFDIFVNNSSHLPIVICIFGPTAWYRLADFLSKFSKSRTVNRCYECHFSSLVIIFRLKSNLPIVIWSYGMAASRWLLFFSPDPQNTSGKLMHDGYSL